MYLESWYLVELVRNGLMFHKNMVLISLANVRRLLVSNTSVSTH